MDPAEDKLDGLHAKKHDYIVQDQPKKSTFSTYLHTVELERRLEDVATQQQLSSSALTSFLNLGDRSDSDIEKARQADLVQVHYVHFFLNQGDTLVFIDLPNTPRDARARADCNGIVYASQHFRVHSENLLALSESKFPQMLDNEIYQARVRRRRKPAVDLMEGIKYLLDLTPASEGEDLVFQVTELSLTPGVMNWWTSKKLHKYPTNLVGGHDDICSCRLTRPAESTPPKDEVSPEIVGEEEKPLPEKKPPVILPPLPEALLIMRADGKTELFETPPHRQIPDYCVVRHFNSIIRLMMMIEGKSVALNSAPRVWSLLAIAKIFDCTSVVTEAISTWIMYCPRFMEILPEEALKIGFTLQVPDITRLAFRILVNELALEEAAGNDGYAPDNNQATLFGRRRGDLSDELRNLTQHSARALTDRVTSQFEALRNDARLDFWEIDDWDRLRAIEELLVRANFNTSHALSNLHRLMNALSFKVGEQIESVTHNGSDNLPTLLSMDQDRATYVAPGNYEKLINIIPKLNLTQRLLLPFIYIELGQRCESVLFAFYSTSKHQDTRGATFETLIDNVTRNLRVLVATRPHLYYDSAWSILFEDDVPSARVAMTTGPRPMRALIDLQVFESFIRVKFRETTHQWNRIGREFHMNSTLTRHLLLTLDNDREMKFLPLWAGGCDDGSGGVFEPFVPSTEMGPNGPGPAYHTGYTIPSAPPSISDSLVDHIRDMKVQGSTTAGSVDVHDSISTVYRPDRVIACDSSIPSESFSEDDSDFQDARRLVPAHSTAEDDISLESLGYSDDDDGMSDVTEVADVSENGSAHGSEDTSTTSGLETDSDGDSIVVL